jgi:hypothetical protein
VWIQASAELKRSGENPEERAVADKPLLGVFLAKILGEIPTAFVLKNGYVQRVPENCYCL